MHHGAMTTAVMVDETPSGRELGRFELDLPDAITVRDLIRARVREEVARYNTAPTGSFRTLIRPDGADEDASGYRMRKPRRLDWEQQAEVAVNAFVRGRFFLLVAGRQVEALEAEVDLSEANAVTFVKLVPLVGG